MEASKIKEILDPIRTILESLEEPCDVVMEIQNGITDRLGDSLGALDREPNHTKTITVKINGGARDYNWGR